MDRRLIAPVVIGIGGIGGIGGLGLRHRFRQDIDRAWRRLDSVDRHIATTRFGPVEYGTHSTGTVTEREHDRTVLVSHGIFHGCDGGLLEVEDLVTDRPVLAPSRFGYLGSALPDDATVADQADAMVELLDHLELTTVDVIGVSAGTGAAVQLALRHPGRVGHLIISSGNWPGSPTAQGPPLWAKMFYTDVAMWLARTVAPSTFARLIGVPPGFPTSEDEAVMIAETGDSIFPIKPRRGGALFDAYVANPDIERYRLEDITVPTLIIHARDDPLASFEAAEAAAHRMRNAVLLALDSGGHLQLGQGEPVRERVEQFLQSWEIDAE